MGVKTIQIEADAVHTGRKAKDIIYFQPLVSGTMLKSKLGARHIYYWLKVCQSLEERRNECKFQFKILLWREYVMKKHIWFSFKILFQWLNRSTQV